MALAAVPALAFASGAGLPQDSEAQRVLETEDAYVAAELSRDEAALRRLVDDRFVFNSSGGETSGKEELIQGLLQMAMTSQEITERSVLVEDDVALVFGTTELRFASTDGGERVSTLRYTATYVKRAQDWRLLALQMQPTPPRRQETQDDMTTPAKD